MEQQKYEQIPTSAPADESEIVLTPTKDSINRVPLMELNKEEDLLLYDTRVSKKPTTPTSGKYKVVRVVTMAVVCSIVAVLLAASIYMCITCECISRNYKELCEDGFCYEIDVKNFQDSNNDGIGDFDGISNSLKFLREIGVQTVIVPISSIVPNNSSRDVSSFISMAKQGRKVGISVILRLDEPPKQHTIGILNNTYNDISGFIVYPKDTQYMDGDNLWKDVKCYIAVPSLSEINVLHNNKCNGTFYEPTEDIYTGSNDIIQTLGASNYTDKSVNILSLKAIDFKQPNWKINYLSSLVFMGLTNGSISIKGGDELGLPLNKNYSSLLNSSDPFQKEAIALMKNIKINRLYAPKIGGACNITSISYTNSTDIKIIEKTCVEKDVPEVIVMVWNQGAKNITLPFNKLLAKDNYDIRTARLLFKVNTLNSVLNPNTFELLLEASSIAVANVKYKSTRPN